MTVSLPPTTRLVALIGLLCACALGSGALLLARHKSTPGATATPPVVHSHHVATTPHDVTVTSTRHHLTSPATTAPSVTSKPKVPKVTVDSRIPSAVAASLQHNEIVVAALYAPEAASDPTAVAEARAGAQLAGAGFVKLNVLDEAVAKQLARVADNLSDPSVLVFRTTGVANRIDGFADRDLVAQAAQNAESQLASSR